MSIVSLSFGLKNVANAGVHLDAPQPAQWFQTQYLRMCKALGNVGRKILLSTILPRVMTTDANATYANQTKLSTENLRVQINNWLRDKSSSGAFAYLNANMGSGAGSVAAIFDPCVQLERNWDGTTATPIVLDSNGQQTIGTGGYCLINCWADGTHPNVAGATLAKAAVPVSLIKL